MNHVFVGVRFSFLLFELVLEADRVGDSQGGSAKFAMRF